jgi:hypothetical protein
MRKHTPTIWARLDVVRVSDRRGRALSAAKVARYRDWLEQGRVAPPVRLARNGDVFVVRDGRHRVAAALAAGHAVIEAELHRRIAALLGRMVRRLAAALSSDRGDEALVAGRLACNEEAVGSTPTVSIECSWRAPSARAAGSIRRTPRVSSP